MLESPIVQIVLLWVALMSGILSILREVTGLFSSQFQSRSVFSVCVWIAFAVSALWLIYIQNNRIHELEARFKSPVFEGEITSTWWGFTGDGQLFIVADCLIRNPLGPPSAVMDFQPVLHLKTRDENGVIPIPGPRDEMITLQGRTEPLILPLAKYLIERTGQGQPVPTGGLVSGWLKIIFGNVTNDETLTPSTIEISFTDVIERKKHSIAAMTLGRRGVTLPGVR